MKNKGFSLIEIIVAMAIIITLSGVIGLKLKSHIATSKNTKAIITLNNLRTAAEIYSLENSSPLYEGSSTEYSEEKVKEALQKLRPYLTNNSTDILKTGKIDIGASKKETDGKIISGGTLRVTFNKANSSTEGNEADNSIWLEPSSDKTGDFDMKGKKWIEY